MQVIHYLIFIHYDKMSGGAAPHFAPIFLANDLFTVWLLSLFLSLAAGVYPAWKASRLSPLEALRR
jgi:putative ABC transport system permease protein